MPLHFNDLIAAGVDISDFEQDANDFLDDTLGKSADSMNDVLLILGQLDPLEMKDGKPRWTENQREMILEAAGTIGNHVDLSTIK